MGREFVMPGCIYTGWDALALAEEKLTGMGKKALIVTDPMMLKLGNTERIEQMLTNNGIACSVYSDITGEPTDRMIEAGVKQYREEDCDFLIAVGGGSPIDSMKAIAAMSVSDGTIADYMGQVISGTLPPMAAIPTTAGTGSEATQFTIITDTLKDIKMLLKGAVLIPDLAIVDPEFTLTAPPAITAATGLDALTHAVEAYTSKKAQPLSDTFAISAVKRIFRYLPTAFKDGSDRTAREQMAIASLEAGIAFNNSSVTIVHGMSRPIGALFHVAHGISNAMLLKECLGYVLEGTYERFGDLGRAIQVSDEGDEDREAARMFMKAISQLLLELQIPTLKEYGIKQDEFEAVIDKMAADAMASGSPQNSRKDLTAEELAMIYRRLWE